MTLIDIDARDAALRPIGDMVIAFVPTRRLVAPDYVVLPAPVRVRLVGGLATVELIPTDNGAYPGEWAWQAKEYGSGDGVVRTFLVPDSSDALPYSSLVDVDPATLDPTAAPEAAWWVEAQAIRDLIAAGGGGTGDGGGGGGGVGPQGPAGPAGPKGNMGSTGATGPVGPAGPTGATGPQGAKGDTGDPGSPGAQGPKGDAGDTGPAGAKGDTGDPGPQGTEGDAGPAGDTGPAGAKGDTGDAGAAGPTGPQGEPGDTGPQGAKGDTGATGSTGLQGIKGDTGPAGPTGATGATGSPPSTSATALSVVSGHISTNAALGIRFKVAMTAAATLDIPTNPTDGMVIAYTFVQDATGGRVLTITQTGTGCFKLGTGIASVVLSTAASARDVMVCMYDSASAKWEILAFQPGF